MKECDAKGRDEESYVYVSQRGEESCECQRMGEESKGELI